MSSYDAARGHISAVLTESLSIGDGIEVRKGGDSCGNIVTYLSERGNVLKTAPAGKRITIGDVKGRIRPGADIYRITHRALMVRGGGILPHPSRKDTGAYDSERRGRSAGAAENIRAAVSLCVKYTGR